MYDPTPLGLDLGCAFFVDMGPRGCGSVEGSRFSLGINCCCSFDNSEESDMICALPEPIALSHVEGCPCFSSTGVVKDVSWP